MGIREVIQHTCPKCKHVNVPVGKALTIALTCEKCNLYFCPLTNIHDQFKERVTPVLPIGAKGNINGVNYRVMGFSVKREQKYRYVWHEYFLFNPVSGIAFLTVYDGNWNFLKPYAKHPWAYGGFVSEPSIEEGTFRLYAKYKAQVLFASGEFFTDIIEATESSTHYEHIDPPYILTYEDNSKHISAYLGEYISPGDVAKAFSVDKSSLPKKNGKGYTQPNWFSFDEGAFLRVTGLTLILTILLQIYLTSNSANELVYEGHFDQANLNGQKMFTTPAFELKGGTKNVQFDLSAPVSNDWFFAEYELVNEKTGDDYVFTNEIEYYYGYEGGESWNEGSTKAEAFLSSIPEGTYHINIFPEFSMTNHQVDVSVRRDVPFYSNFYIFIFVLLLIPAGFYFYKHKLEVARWEDSDYSPYYTFDDE